MSRFEALREGVMQIDRRLAWIAEKKRALLAELERAEAALDKSKAAILSELRASCEHEVLIQSEGGGTRFCAACGWKTAEFELFDPTCRLRYAPKLAIAPEIDYSRLGAIEPLVSVPAVPWPVPQSLAGSRLTIGGPHGRPTPHAPGDLALWHD